MSADSDRELLTSRLINAPRTSVFGAFTDPARLAIWWGPNGFTNEFEECEPRPGGAWRFVMRGPDGTAYSNQSRFTECSPERIIIEHLSAPHFELTVTLDDQGGRTMIGWRRRFDTADQCRAIARFARDANEQNLDRLAREVAKSA